MVKSTKKEERVRTLDESERLIVRELIRNPRASDSEISKRTRVPVMTVNRKRKNLEKEKLLRYYTSLDKGEFGLPIFGARKLFIVKFKIGITKEQYLDSMEQSLKWRMFNSYFVSMAHLGEKDGHLALIIILDAPTEADLVEEFNGIIVPSLTARFGKDAIVDITTASLSKLIRIHHNYMPHENMENARIKDSWSDDLIFIDQPMKQKQLPSYFLK